MNKQLLSTALALVVGSAYSLAAFSQAKPETLVEQRQAAMKLQGKYLYSLIPMASGKIPYDAKIVARNAAYLEVLTQMSWDGFDPGTASVKNTRALPEIYKDMATFNSKQEALRAEVAKFVATVKSGNEANTKTAIVELNKVCNGCHETFRGR